MNMFTGNIGTCLFFSLCAIYYTTSSPIPDQSIQTALPGLTEATDIDRCEQTPCQNGGFCVEVGDQGKGKSFTCECKLGFNGELCESVTPECESDLCQNESTCVATTDGSRCDCRQGYRGDACQVATEQHEGDSYEIKQASGSRVLWTVSCVSAVVIVVLLFAFCGRVQEERKTLMEKQASLVTSDRWEDVPNTDICSVSVQTAVVIFKSCIQTVDSDTDQPADKMRQVAPHKSTRWGKESDHSNKNEDALGHSIQVI